MADFRQKLKQYEITNVQGSWEEVVGVGSYGTVYRVDVDGVPRIAKQLQCKSDNCSDVDDEDQEMLILEQVYQECQLLSRLNHHPNIVEFVGIHFAGKEDTPGVISFIMEQMSTDLEHFLDDKNHLVIPMSIKASILLDVSYGLLYLHSMKPEPIVHQDLTVRNILLSKDLRAKIADTGVAEMLKIEPNSTAATEHTTPSPSNLSYMPPEVLKQECEHIYTARDIFSFGHLALCTASQESVQVEDISDCDVEALTDFTKKNQLHVLKRKKSLNKLKLPNSFLRELIVRCLNDIPKNRPTAHEVSHVMKIVCYKFPKTPVDIATVWNETEVRAVGIEIPEDLKSIQVFRKQLNRLTSENEVLVSEKDSLESESRQLSALKIKMQECQESLLKEKQDHDSTKETMEVFRGNCFRTLAELSSKLETATVQSCHYKELLAENGLSLLLEGRPRIHKTTARVRKRSNTCGDIPLASPENTAVDLSRQFVYSPTQRAPTLSACLPSIGE